MTVYFHRTDHAAAILADGFRVGTGMYLTTHELPSVINGTG